MIYTFDYFDRYEQPELVLCRPNDQEIGVISNFEGLSSKICFNEISEISYTIYKSDEYYEDETGKIDESAPNIYREHLERRQVHVLGIGYFIITDIAEISDEKGTCKKVTAKSCECELNNLSIPYIDGTYKLYTPESYSLLSSYERFKYLEGETTEDVSQDDTGSYLNDNCLLFVLLSHAPMWRLSDECIMRFTEDARYIDLANQFRTFESEDETIYSFFKNKLSSSYECFVMFNIEDRTIDILSYDDVMVDSGIILSESNILNSCEVNTTIDDYVNCLKISGGTEDINISSINPMGNQIIYDFSHDIESGLVCGELKDALEYWQTHLEDNRILTNIGTTFPQNICPFGEQEGNDLYKFVTTTSKVFLNWLSAYEKARIKKEEFSAVMPTIKAISTPVEEGGTPSTQKGEYKVIITRPLGTNDRVTVSDTAGVVLTEFTTTLSNGVAQAGALAQHINSQTNYNLTATYTSDKNYFILTQKTAGNAIPMIRIKNEQTNIEGTIDIVIEKVGSAGVRSVYQAYTKSSYSDEDPGHITFYEDIESVEWQETYYGEGESVSLEDANKALLYLQSERDLIDSELAKLNALHDGYVAQKEAILTELGDSETGSEEYTTVTEQKEVIERYINLTMEQISAYTVLSANMTTWITSLSSKTSEAVRKNNFQYAFKEYAKTIVGEDEAAAEAKTIVLYNELCRILKQQSYTDETIVITEAMGMNEKFQQELELYNKGVNTLAILVRPSSEITVDAEAFIFSKEYEKLVDGLKMGSCIYTELPSGEVPLYHLNEITIDYDEPSCELVFGNRIRSSNPADIFSDIQNAATTAAEIVASERIDWGINTAKVNYLMSQKDADIATTARSMRNSVNNVSLDSSGLRCYATNENNEETYGFWGANGVIMFEDENKQKRAAVGRIIRSDGSTSYGFLGQSIIANTITADKLAVGSVSTGTNYLRDGSFEAVEGTGNGRHFTWWEGSKNENINENTNTDASYSVTGKQSLKPGTTDVWQVASLEPATYTVSLYYRAIDSEDSEKSPRLEIWRWEQRPDNSRSGYGIATLKKFSNEWNRYHTQIVVSESDVADSTGIGVGFRGQNVVVDNVMLDKSSMLGEYRPHISEVYAAYTQIDDKGISVYNGKISIFNTESEKVFYADGNGNLTLKGEIYATSGSIGGWKIESSSLRNSNDSIGMSPTGENAFWAGSSANPNFKVTKDGHLYATEANITGEITATSGSIGGWKVNDHSIYRRILSDNNSAKISAGISTEDSYPAFWSGYGGSEFPPNTYSEDTSPSFMVTQAGKLYAKGANITGILTTTSKEDCDIHIGGYTLEIRDKNSDSVSNGQSARISRITYRVKEGVLTNSGLALSGHECIYFGMWDKKTKFTPKFRIVGDAFEPAEKYTQTLGSKSLPFTNVYTDRIVIGSVELNSAKLRLHGFV